ncbi:MAG: hypothetical protein RLZZ524_1455 [Pseudomonadota bacterium]|jgi:hypothetical protein
MSTITKVVEWGTGTFGAPLMFKALLVLAPLLVVSLGLNLHQFGALAAAAEKGRADCLESQVKAQAEANGAQADKQDDINQTASAEASKTTERLADIASSAEGTLAQLRRQYADALRRKGEWACDPLPALRLRTVNAQLSRPRSD